MTDRPSFICLCCGKTLEGQAEISQWHTGCIKKFFASQTVPEISIQSDDFEQFARIAVENGNAVTGVQKKLSLHIMSEGNTKRLTLIGYPAGFILKPPADEYPSLPELEHAVMSMADDAGIQTVPHALITLSGRGLGYITRRIDRVKTAGRAVTAGSDMYEKIPMEDFCQLSLRLTEDKYKGSYEQCGKIISTYSSRPGIDAAEFFYRVLFCFITGNADMHLKNFSLIESAQGYHLSPAYDLLPTNIVLPEDAEETALNVNGKKKRLTGKDFYSLGLNIGLAPKAAENIITKTSSLSVILKRNPALSLLSEKHRTELEKLIDERCSRLKV